MKKTITLMLAFIGIMAVFTGCSENKKSAESESSSIIRTASLPIDTAILGRWENDSIGYRFDENHKVSLIMDFSAMGNYFTPDGDFQMAGALMTKEENIAYDGTNMTVIYEYVNEEDNLPYSEILLSMTRDDEPNFDSYDGTYTLNTGICFQIISDMIGMSVEDIINYKTVKAEIRGESFVITVNDYCEYETRNNELEFFSEYMHYIDTSANSVKYNYSIDDDTLTLEYIDGEESFTEIYKKVEETFAGE